MKKKVIEKYLDNYAENEINFTPKISEIFDEVIVIPSHNEFEELLDVLNESLPRISHNKHNLLVLVINGSEDSNENVHKTNIQLLNYLQKRINISTNSLITSARLNNYHILIINRATDNKIFDKKSGVGLARKIGCDVALFYKNQIRSNWIRTTDADVILPDNYLEINPDANKFSAITYPFYHGDLINDSQGTALELYEIYLRYYYLGLVWAGSPYAFQTVGSSMAISAESYAKVRGFPSKREAAEDFYMLNKLAKILPVYRDTEALIRIRGRISDRVPFGTGASMSKISKKLISGDKYNVYNPEVFNILKLWYEIIEEFCNHRDINEIINHKEKILIEKLSILGLEEALTNLLKQTNDQKLLKRHIHTWFDGFRTLKLINLLSHDYLKPIEWNKAIENSKFISIKSSFNSKIEELRFEMFKHEMNVTKQYSQSITNL